MSGFNSELPKTLDERIDYKTLMSSILYNLIDQIKKDKPEANNTKMYFYTTIGMIEGTWLPLDEDSDDKYKTQETLHKLIMEHRNKTISKEELENKTFKLVNDSGAIPLVNVKLTTYSGREHHLSYFLLFSDQIVGLSYGELK